MLEIFLKILLQFLPGVRCLRCNRYDRIRTLLDIVCCFLVLRGKRCLEKEDS